MLTLNHISKSYINSSDSILDVLDSISCVIKQNSFVTFVGPSGCGKSTLMKIIAGLLEPTSGHMALHEQVIQKSSKDRNMVFQQYSLFPWLTVFENIAFGLRLHGCEENTIHERVTKYIKRMDLLDYTHYYPKKLSGGMQQKVSLARSLVTEPEVLLLDEPFGSLDSLTRIGMQELLCHEWEKNPTTILMVTHDIEEAVFLSDKIVLLSSRPAHIVDTYTIPFSRPRKNAIRYSPSFVRMKAEITRRLMQ